MNQKNNFKNPFIWLIIASVAINLIVSVIKVMQCEDPILPAPDSLLYYELGSRMTEGGGVVMLNVDPDNPKPSAYIMPGYPFAISLFMRVLGTRPGAWVFLIFQKLLAMLSVYLVYLIGKMLFNRQIGFIASILALLDPGYIIYSNQILTESPIITLTIAFLYLATLVYTGRERRWFIYILLGLNGTAMLYIRPEFVMISLFIFPLHFIIKKDPRILVSLAILCFLWSFWVIRNYRQFHRFIPLTSVSQVNRLGGYFPEVKSYLRNSEPVHDMRKLGFSDSLATWYHVYDKYGEAGAEEFYERHFRESLKKHSFRDLFQIVIYKLEMGFGLALRYFSTDFSVRILFFQFLFIFAVIGLYVSVRLKIPILPILAPVWLWLIQTLTVYFPVQRYRTRVMDISVILLGAVGIYYLNRIRIVIDTKKRK